MSKHTITRSCGHNEEVQIFGPYKNREWKLSHEAGRMCYACWQAKVAAEREQASAQAAQAAQSAGMPILIGTLKQIAWAESIRAELAAQIAETRAQLASAKWKDEGDKDLIDAIFAQLLARLSAKEWIDGRHEHIDARWAARKIVAMKASLAPLTN